MPRKRLVRKPDENSGPALADRQPVLLPDHRREMARKLKNKLDR